MALAEVVERNLTRSIPCLKRNFCDRPPFLEIDRVSILLASFFAGPGEGTMDLGRFSEYHQSDRCGSESGEVLTGS